MFFFRLPTIGFLIAGFLFALPIPILKHGPKPEYFLYVASAAKEGIYLYKFNPEGPSLTPQGSGPAASLPGATYLAPHSSNKFLYATTASGSVASFAIHKDTGALRALNAANTFRNEPCFAGVEKRGFMILVSLCGSASVETFRVAGDGAVGELTGLHQQTGEKAGPRNFTFSPDNLFVLVPALDKIYSYHVDPNYAGLGPNTPPSLSLKPGSNARAIAFLPDEKFVYVSDDATPAVVTLSYRRETGVLEPHDSLPLAYKPVELEIDPAGRFLYASNPATNTIVVLAIDRKRGTPKLINSVPSGGLDPSQLTVDPSGRFLLIMNRGSNRINVFSIDPKSGIPAPTSLSIEVPNPSCFRLIPIFTEGIH